MERENFLEDLERQGVEILRLTSDLLTSLQAKRMIPRGELLNILLEMQKGLKRLRTKGFQINAPDIDVLIGQAEDAIKLLRSPRIFKQAGQPPPPEIRRGVPKKIKCLECGKDFRSLRIHLRTAHGLTPQRYRAKHKLPPDSPLVCQELLEIKRGSKPPRGK